MSQQSTALVALSPLILVFGVFVTVIVLQQKRRRGFIDVMEARIELYAKHLRNRRPDSALALLNEIRMDFAESAWKMALLDRFSFELLEATRQWPRSYTSDGDQFKWTVALCESLANLAPGGFQNVSRGVAYQAYFYLYQVGLKLLPGFPEFQIEVLRLGRVMGAMGRQTGAATVYDEMAIANDIRAHMALRVESTPTQGYLRPAGGFFQNP